METKSKVGQGMRKGREHNRRKEAAERRQQIANRRSSLETERRGCTDNEEMAKWSNRGKRRRVEGSRRRSEKQEGWA